MIICGGTLAYWLGSRSATKQEKRLKQIILETISECCKDENIQIEDLKFHAPYDWDKVHIN